MTQSLARRKEIGMVLAFLLASACTNESNPASETRSLGNRVIARIHVGEAPERMVVGDGFVWVANHREGSISRIDPRTNETATFPIANRGTTWEMALGGGFVWLDQDTGSSDFVTRRIDVRTGKVVGTVPVGGRLVFAEGSLWISTNEGILYEVDPGNDTPVRTRTVSETDSEQDLAYADGTLWHGASQGELIRIDPRTMEIVATVRGVSASKLFTDGHDLWAADEYEGTISKIDTGSNSVVATVDVGPVTHAAVAEGMVWARPEADRLLVVDGRTNHVVAFRLPSGEYGADVIVGFGSLWIAHFSLNEVWRVEL